MRILRYAAALAAVAGLAIAAPASASAETAKLIKTSWGQVASCNYFAGYTGPCYPNDGQWAFRTTDYSATDGKCVGVLISDPAHNGGQASLWSSVCAGPVGVSSDTSYYLSPGTTSFTVWLCKLNGNYGSLYQCSAPITVPRSAT